MVPRFVFVPQTAVASISTIGQTQIKAQYMTTTGHKCAAFIFQVSVTITGTAPGTQRDLSQIIHDIQVDNDDVNPTRVVALDGQTLMLSSLDAIKRFYLEYQTWTPTVCAATGVTAVGQYAIGGPFDGSIFNITFNLNPATQTGYTSPSAATYTITGSLLCTSFDTFYTASKAAFGNKTTIAGHIQPISGYIIKGHYVVNQIYTSPDNSCDCLVGIDNAELSTKVSSIACGGTKYSAQSCQVAEDTFNSTLPNGISVGSAFAGNATVPPKNVQDGNPVGLGEFSGPTPSPLVVSLLSSQTMLILERIPMPGSTVAD